MVNSFSCTILLLQKNADISVNIVIVPDALKPKEEEEDEESDDETRQQRLDKKGKKEKPVWTWLPQKAVEKPPEIKSFSVFQVGTTS